MTFAGARRTRDEVLRQARIPGEAQGHIKTLQSEEEREHRECKDSQEVY